MAESHAYTTTQGGLVQTINQLRQSFPSPVDAATLQKLGFAPKNESYVLNVLRFLGLIDDDGKRTGAATKIFSLHNDKQFSEAFAKLVENAYKALFDLHGEKAWKLEQDSLIAFFRANDSTSAIVGKRQAATFRILAAFSGHGEVPEAKTATRAISGKLDEGKKSLRRGGEAKAPRKTSHRKRSSEQVGLTVRIEVNLPADGDQATYDRIFKSIRENLLSE